MLALETGESVLVPELLEKLEVLEEVLPALGRAASAGPCPVYEASLADLVNDGNLFRDLEGVLGLEVVEGVPFVGQRPRGYGLTGQP